MSWPVSAADFDVYVLQNGSVVSTSASSADPEVVVLPALSTGANPYTIRVIPFAPAGQSYTATVTLENRPATPPPGSGPAPEIPKLCPKPDRPGWSRFCG